MKAGKSSATAMVLPSLVDEILGGDEGRIVGGDAADQLDQLHQRHRIHEMNPDELLRPVGGRRQPGDRDRRRVGADDRLRLERRTEIAEDLPLDLFLLGRRFDHEIALAEIVEAFRRRNLLERALAVLFGDALARDLPRHVAVDGRDAGLDPVDADIVEPDFKARQRADMRDAAAHLPSPDHADGSDGMRLLGARRWTFFDFTHGRAFVLSFVTLRRSVI